VRCWCGAPTFSGAIRCRQRWLPHTNLLSAVGRTNAYAPPYATCGSAYSGLAGRFLPHQPDHPAPHKRFPDGSGVLPLCVPHADVPTFTACCRLHRDALVSVLDAHTPCLAPPTSPGGSRIPTRHCFTFTATCHATHVAVLPGGLLFARFYLPHRPHWLWFFCPTRDDGLRLVRTHTPSATVVGWTYQNGRILLVGWLGMSPHTTLPRGYRTYARSATWRCLPPTFHHNCRRRTACMTFRIPDAFGIPWHSPVHGARLEHDRSTT